MKSLLEKLNYKGQNRIAIINAEESFSETLKNELKDVLIDEKIDPRFPYDFIITFVKSASDVDLFAPIVLHNLIADGVLWFFYPKKTSKKFNSDIDRDHGWKAMNESGLRGIHQVAIDNDWSALRFRNSRYIRSVRRRFSH